MSRRQEGWKEGEKETEKGKVNDEKKEKNTEEKKEDCEHPLSHVVQGSNQYGRWERCLKCKTKISYTPHSRRQMTKKEKGYMVQYVNTTEEKPRKKEAAGVKAEKDAREAASSTAELQQTLVESNSQLLQGMTHLLTQAITPWSRVSRLSWR